jgi:hypothetical protein
VSVPPHKKHPAYESGSMPPIPKPTTTPRMKAQPRPESVSETSGQADLLQSISMMLDDKLDARLKPVQERLSTLESSSHKKFVDTGAAVVRQKSEAELTRNDDLAAIKMAFKKVEENSAAAKTAAEETKAAVTTSIVPAANAANNKADAQNVSLDRIEQNSDKLTRWYNHPGLKVVINSIVSAIGAYLAAGGKLPGCH